MQRAIAGVEGVEVGHYTDLAAGTGCTALICREGAMGGVDVRGGAPGTRETDLLRPGNLVERVHGVVLSGGSAFGLDATAGVVRYLEEHGIGVKLGPAIIPIVPAAILYDLNLISHLVRPGPEAGYRAALASSAGAVAEGSVGAGTGATVGKAMGLTRAVKGGIGTSSVELPGGITVGAMVAVNAYGSVVDHRTGEVIAGPRREDGAGFHDTVELLTKEDGQARKEASPVNTTIGVVATNAALTREQAHFLARLSHDGLALTIRPCHTLQDGDTIFALATAKGPAPAGLPDLIGLGTAAVEVVATSVLRALLTADGLGGVPSVRELGHG